MKFTKMSLVAVLLVGSSAFAIDNVKVDGDANLFYQTQNANSNKLFEKESSNADAAVNLNVTADLVKKDKYTISAGASYTVLSTLGLENNLVSGVWGTAHQIKGNNSQFGNKVENANWVTEAWVAAASGKSTVKIGRMELDTPLAFTEKWTIEKNTFESAVVVNQDIPDTTLVGAYIGNGNGTENFGVDVTPISVATGGVVNTNGNMTTYGTDGAYALGLVNNSYKALKAQAWYYEVTKVASAYWLQADFEMSGISIGAQYSSITADGANTKADNVYAVQLGYEIEDSLLVALSYSAVNNDGSIGRAGFNTATDATYAQTKLYTEAWWNYGQVTQGDTNSIHLTVEKSIKDVIDLGLYVTSIDHNEATNANPDVSEVTLTASKSIGDFDATFVYIHTNTAKADVNNIAQAYLTYNF